MKIYVSHSSNFNYKDELYKPLKKALAGHDVFYPHDIDNSDKKS